ncbi:hypothetical protein NQ315_000596 [Exocentrus adspersus]|uniref:Uncharacterized protein n=1 Tax=Exocentrus adspersus TaxID=1586481 RepID=A0AAV8VN42_9CUCU|nr:hypothetical protein NQ315_000596 [Exocentrus adspersus]
MSHRKLLWIAHHITVLLRKKGWRLALVFTIRFGLFILEEFIIEARRRATLNLELNGIGNGMEVNARRDHGR